MREIEGTITHRQSVPLVYEQSAPVMEVESPHWAFCPVEDTRETEALHRAFGGDVG